MGDAVEIAEYDPAWPGAYERERAAILAALGDLVLAIEHVGSTAVPGLGAKPIIDIMVGLRRLADGEKCVGQLEALGFEHRGDGGIPGRLYFRKKLADGLRTHHIHMVEQGSDFWDRHILFRDYLREHPQEAKEYYRLKVRLAAQFGDDRLGYTEAKTEFIESAVAKARGMLRPEGQASACRARAGGDWKVAATIVGQPEG